MMKLSNAIRLGAMMRPQAFGRLFDDGRSCAVGAALEATGISQCQTYWELPSEWRRIFDMNCPMCGRLIMGLSSVAHLNDEHRWTRERIADWVETVEQMEEQPIAVGVHA